MLLMCLSKDQLLLQQLVIRQHQPLCLHQGQLLLQLLYHVRQLVRAQHLLLGPR